MEKLNINGRLVGPGEPPYFIAEIGANHNGDMELCKKMIDAAYESGAHAVKFQSWGRGLISEAEFSRNTNYADTKRHFGSLEVMVEAYKFTASQHAYIAEYCKEKKIDFLSSVFSEQEVDLLLGLGVDTLKVASMDVNNLPLLKYIGSKGCQVMLSTGMSSLGEIEAAVHTLKAAGSAQILLFHCISIYPPEYEDINLKNIETLSTAFDLPVGFSDHSLGTSIPLAAVAVGACVIEKHFTTDKDMDGWDHWLSASPEEMSVICNDGMNIWKALGSTVRIVSQAEVEKSLKFRRSLVLVKNVKKGDKAVLSDFEYRRPGTGVRPDEVGYVLGRAFSSDLSAGSEISWKDFI